MIIGGAISRNGIKIRLTQERWLHIIYSHKEIDATDFDKALKVVEDPDFILKGDEDELLAVKKLDRKNVWFVVIYKEVNKEDGFIITSYLTSDVKWLLKREIIWKKES